MVPADNGLEYALLRVGTQLILLQEHAELPLRQLAERATPAERLKCSKRFRARGNLERDQLILLGDRPRTEAVGRQQTLRDRRRCTRSGSSSSGGRSAEIGSDQLRVWHTEWPHRDTHCLRRGAPRATGSSATKGARSVLERRNLEAGGGVEDGHEQPCGRELTLAGVQEAQHRLDI